VIFESRLEGYVVTSVQENLEQLGVVVIVAEVLTTPLEGQPLLLVGRTPPFSPQKVMPSEPATIFIICPDFGAKVALAHHTPWSGVSSSEVLTHRCTGQPLVNASGF
jgi:hypothetical protein